MARKIVLWGVGLLVAFTAAMVGVAIYVEETSSLGIRQRARVRSWIDWFPPAAYFKPRCGGSNETSAISTLRNISSSQEQFRYACAVDEDGDGVGEYGTFADLSAAESPRGRDAAIHPPVLSGAFKSRTLRGEVSRSGYLFQLRLPAKDGSFVTELTRNIGLGVLDPAAAETQWRCYAWPATYDRSALRTFYIDEAGDIWGTEDARYSGAGSGPSPGAATASPGTLVPDTPTTRATYTGADGNVWTKIN